MEHEFETTCSNKISENMYEYKAEAPVFLQGKLDKVQESKTVLEQVQAPLTDCIMYECAVYHLFAGFHAWDEQKWRDERYGAKEWFEREWDGRWDVRDTYIQCLR